MEFFIPFPFPLAHYLSLEESHWIQRIGNEEENKKTMGSNNNQHFRYRSMNNQGSNGKLERANSDNHELNRDSLEENSENNQMNMNTNNNDENLPPTSINFNEASSSSKKPLFSSNKRASTEPNQLILHDLTNTLISPSPDRLRQPTKLNFSPSPSLNFTSSPLSNGNKVQRAHSDLIPRHSPVSRSSLF